MTITNTEKSHLKACKNVSLDKSGVDVWGIYVLFVETDKWGSTYEHRVFLVDKLICQYKLPIGGAKTRTTWTRHNFDSRADALAWLDGSTTKIYGGSLRRNELTAMVGAPVLVQLTESDVESVRKGRMPAARYRGQQKHTSIYGKVDMITPLAFNLKGNLPVLPRPATSMIAASAAALTGTVTTATITPLSADGSPAGSLTFPVPAESVTITLHNVDEPIGDEPF
jgi:hypothetical protein